MQTSLNYRALGTPVGYRIYRCTTELYFFFLPIPTAASGEVKPVTKTSLCSYRRFLIDISLSCEERDLVKMKFLARDIVPPAVLERVSSMVALFSALEKRGSLGTSDLSFLETLLENIPRRDLVGRLQDFVRQKQSESQGTTFTKHIMFNPFTPESDQCQISPAASASILHNIVWRM